MIWYPRGTRDVRSAAYLAPADAAARKRGRTPAARIMRTFGHRPVSSITSSDVGRFLARLDAEPSVGARTVNKHRQVLASVFEHAMRPDTFGLASNPVIPASRL